MGPFLRREPGKPLARAKGVCAGGRESPDTARSCLSVWEMFMYVQLLTMDLLALATMKNAAKCEIKCDLHYL